MTNLSFANLTLLRKDAERFDENMKYKKYN